MTRTAGQKRARRSKDKGRLFQVRVAEQLARALGLTILAEPPTPSGKRNGVWWLGEGEFASEGATADLKVRRSSQPGADVALLSERALRAVAWNGAPLHLECKCVERGWGFDAAFWSGKRQKALEAWWRQACIGADAPGMRTRWPVLILGRNRWPALAAWKEDVSESALLARPDIFQVEAGAGPRVLALGGGFVFAPLARLLTLLDGWPKRV